MADTTIMERDQATEEASGQVAGFRLADATDIAPRSQPGLRSASVSTESMNAKPIRVGGKWSWVLHLTIPGQRKTLCGQQLNRRRDVLLSWTQVDPLTVCLDCRETRTTARHADKSQPTHRRGAVSIDEQHEGFGHDEGCVDPTTYHRDNPGSPCKVDPREDQSAIAGTIIRVEDGTEGRGYEEDVELQLTGELPYDLAQAIDIEHPCTDEDCDIREANDEGFSRAAAHLLYGATETPVLDAVLKAYDLGPTDICPFNSQEWKDWVKHFHAVFYAGADRGVAWPNVARPLSTACLLLAPIPTQQESRVT